MNEIATMLLDNGCKVWTHPSTGEERIYLNSFAQRLLNIEIDRYNTGNLRTFTIDGVRTSNCEGRRILGALEKAYYSVTKGKFHAGNTEITDRITAAAETAVRA